MNNGYGKPKEIRIEPIGNVRKQDGTEVTLLRAVVNKTLTYEQLGTPGQLIEFLKEQGWDI